MKRRWTGELADFQRFCSSERRLAPTTCSAFERDVWACGQGIRDLGAVKVTHLRAFLAEEQKRRTAVSSEARTTAAPDPGAARPQASRLDAALRERARAPRRDQATALGRLTHVRTTIQQWNS